MNLLEEYNGVNRIYYREELGNFEEDFLESRERIIEFFTCGSKENLSIGYDSLNQMRSSHSMSLVYLGALLNDKLNLNIEVNVSNTVFDFKYIWSILCFYHDLGYIFEEDRSQIYKIRNANDLKQLRRYAFFHNKYNYKICFEGNFRYAYTRNFMDSHNQMFMTFSSLREKTIYTNEEYESVKNLKDLIVLCKGNSIIRNKSQFFKSTVEKYYEYRKEVCDKYDHGILGGFMLFNNLVKNYVTIMENECDKTYFIYNDKEFRIEQIPLFSYLADCIVSHNIFFPKDEYLDLYREHELNELINYKLPIKLNDNPVLFLLYLVDTIDPIKYFKKLDFSYENILSSINIEFFNNAFTISKADNSYINDELFGNYLNEIMNLKKWLGLKITLDGNYSIKIKIL